MGGKEIGDKLAFHRVEHRFSGAFEAL